MTTTMQNEEVVRIQIPDRMFFRIGDVADLLSVKPYVLRYWESEFPMITPTKSKTGQRVYSKADVETIALIHHLLYSEKYSIEGARRRIKGLRKEGELDSFKKENVLSETSLNPELEKKLRTEIDDLKLLAQTPVSRLFSI